MSPTIQRLPVGQRRAMFKPPSGRRLGSAPGRPKLQAHMSREAAMVAAVIESVKKPVPFRRPPVQEVRDAAAIATMNLLGPDLPTWAAESEKELFEHLKVFLDGMAGTRFLRIRAIRELMSQEAKRYLIEEMEPQLPFAPAREEVLRQITDVAAQRRRSSSRVSKFLRAVQTYCAACLGYTGPKVVHEYLYLQVQRRMEQLKTGRYIRMAQLYDKLEEWAEEEIYAIEDLLVEAAEGRGGGRKLRKWDSPRGYVAYELTIRYQRTRKCYLIVEEQFGEKPTVVALKAPREFRRNLRKRFNRNARNKYSNLPPKLR